MSEWCLQLWANTVVFQSLLKGKAKIFSVIVLSFSLEGTASTRSLCGEPPSRELRETKYLTGLIASSCRYHIIFLFTNMLLTQSHTSTWDTSMYISTLVGTYNIKSCCLAENECCLLVIRVVFIMYTECPIKDCFKVTKSSARTNMAV